MTRVCLIGSPEVDLRYELLSRETSREALSSYDLERPFENTIEIRTVSIGAAVSILNDLQWYLVRFVEEAIVLEPSVSGEEWLSRKLATAIRNSRIEPEESDEFLKLYGVESGSRPAAAPSGPATDGPEGSGTQSKRTDESNPATTHAGPDRLVEPLYVRRTDGEVPTYDLRDVDDTLVVRLTEGEFTP